MDHSNSKDRFIYYSLYIRDLFNEVPSILPANEEQKDEFLTSLNMLHKNIEELTKENVILKNIILEGENLQGENEKLKKHIKTLEKQCCLLHMSSMFSTVKSFKGDVSKRYYYSEADDAIYDTANHYGQYHKMLDKKEIAMLLNEYNTFYEQLEEEVTE